MRNMRSFGKASIAAILGVTVTALFVGAYLFVRPAEAAKLQNVKDTLETSAPGVASRQTISYTSVNAVTAGQTIRIGYSDAWTIPAFTVSDISVSGFTLVSTCGAGSDEATLTTSNTSGNKHVTFTVCSGDTIPAGAKTITLGTGATKITNPTKVAAAGTADIYTISIAGTQTDSGNALVAIIEGVTVSATVAESLSFSIAAATAANCDTSFGDRNDAANVTATAVQFGTISTLNTFYHGCQQLTVSTNAGAGYVVTAEENRSLFGATSSTTINDTTCDGGTCSETAADDWTDATKNGFGLSCVNLSGTPCVTDFTTPAGLCGAAPCYKQFACVGSDAQCNPGTGGETKQNVLSGTSPVNSVQARIEYRLSVNALQAADDYSNTITYIATGTF